MWHHKIRKLSMSISRQCGISMAYQGCGGYESENQLSGFGSTSQRETMYRIHDNKK